MKAIHKNIVPDSCFINRHYHSTNLPWICRPGVRGSDCTVRSGSDCAVRSIHGLLYHSKALQKESSRKLKVYNGRQAHEENWYLQLRSISYVRFEWKNKIWVLRNCICFVPMCKTGIRNRPVLILSVVNNKTEFPSFSYACKYNVRPVFPVW